MHEKLNELIEKAKKESNEIDSLPALNEAKSRYAGKKSELSKAMQSLKDMAQEERAAFGKEVNEAKAKILSYFEAKEASIKEALLNKKLASEKIDITLPGRNYKKGSKHPFQVIVDEVTDYFVGLGYKVAEGPEVELDKYNFELLNIPHDHPAREMQDSFFIDDNTLMRSHTSPVQAHVMEAAKGQAPIKIICPGKVFRRDEDATHSHQFGQVEGLLIDKNISLADLKGTLEVFVKKMLGENSKLRFRPSYFPFTEPSYEVDVSCFKCGGKGCNLCKQSGWIEILGSGMVHPNVLKMNGYDPEKYTGFAFGTGLDRLAMFKYGITDIRYFYTNDVRFLNQFDRKDVD